MTNSVLFLVETTTNKKNTSKDRELRRVVLFLDPIETSSLKNEVKKLQKPSINKHKKIDWKLNQN